MKKISSKSLLVIIFILLIIFQLIFVLQTSNFSNDKSYLNLRLVNYISENKVHMVYDDLSYGGRPLIYSFIFHYLFLLLSFVPFAFKLIPIISSSSIVIVTYLISYELTRDKKSSLLASLMSAFIPVYFSLILNRFIIFSLAIPILFFMLYSFMKMDKDKKYLDYFVISSFILPLLHPIAFLIPISLIFYLILTTTESIEVSKLKKEVIVFSTFLIILIEFILYKKAFLLYGFDVVYQNIPLEILDNYFSNINIIKIVVGLGILPLIYGLVGVVYSYFKGKRDSFFLINGFLLAVFLLLLLRLINLELGLAFLGISLSMLSGLTLAKYFSYIKKTKFHNFEKHIILTLVIAVFVLSIIPSYIASNNVIKKTITDDELFIFEELKEKTPPGSTVLAPLEFGHLITYKSNRKNTIDSNFLMAPNAEQRFLDVKDIYTTHFEIKALELIEKYDISYMVINDKVKEIYNIKEISYLEDEKCFKKITEEIYEVLC